MLALLLTLVVPAQGAAAYGTSGDGERLLGAGGLPIFATILNYEGPADRVSLTRFGGNRRAAAV